MQHSNFFLANYYQGIVLKVSSIYHEIYSILVLKSFLSSFLFFESRIINLVTNTAADMFLDI